MIIVKIGGGENVNVDSILDDLKSLNGPFIIVHGANALRDEIAEKIGVIKETITSVSGHTSVKSTDELLDVMLMSYAGLRNKRIVEKMQQLGYQAVGLTGADAGVIRGKRNRGIRARVKGKKILIRDNSGKPKSANTDFLNLLIKNEYTPVLTVPIIDENNKLINSENDDIIAMLCQELEISKVIMFIDEKGLLEDLSNPNSVVSSLNSKKLEEWVERLDGRMKRKLYAIQNMISENGPEVIISDGRVDKPIRHALENHGTSIQY